MKVKAKNLLFSSLPSKKDLKKLLSADMGTSMNGGPGDPRIKQMMKTLPDNYFDIFGGQPQKAQLPGIQPIGATGPNVQGPNIPMPAQVPQSAQVEMPYNPGVQNQQTRPQTNLPRPNIHKGNALLLGLAAIDAAIPGERIRNQEVIHPQEGYNPYSRGTGSQALAMGGTVGNPQYERENPIIIPEGVEDNMPSAARGAGIPYGRMLQYEDLYNMETAKSGNWIQGAVNPKHKGYCTPMTKSTCTPKRKAFAMTMKKHHGFHKNGGIIPDNMSAFTQYEQGGTARGGSDTFNLLEQIVMHPNQMDMAHAGGFLEHIMYHPNAADMQGFDDGGQVPVPQQHPQVPSTPVRMPPSIPPINMQQYPQAAMPDASFQKAPNLLDYEPLPTGVKRPRPNGFQLHHKNPYKSYLFGLFPGNWLKENGGSIRGGSDTTNILEQIMMHPNKSDMSKAKAGKSLSKGKAREILHDGTAHGKPITDRQRRYFGAVASGYAADGTTTGPGKDSLVATTPGFTAENIINSKKSGIEDANYVDKLNFVLGTGNQARGGEMTHYTQDQKNLLTDAYIWRQQHGGKTPEENIQGFFDRPVTTGNATDALRQKVSKIGGSPLSMYNTSPLVSLQQRQGINTGAGMTSNTEQVTANQSFANGGIMYDNGGEIGTMWGGNVEQISGNPNDGGTMQFNGASHDNGGIGMHYNGNPVEVEGGETASKDSMGNLNIYGNMHLPGTKTKFKDVAKEIAKKEKRYDYLKTRGSELVNNSNPANKFEKLAFNAGNVMMQGGSVGQRDLAEKKENLAILQRSMLQTADEFGIDPQHMSQGRIKKAKNNGQARGGAYIPFAEDGLTTSGDPSDPTRADRNNNPGNIKYGKWAKQHGATKADADGFAIFPTRETGLGAMKGLLKSKDYKNLPVSEAINKWTDNKPYHYDLGNLAGKKVSDLSDDEFEKVVSSMRTGEGTMYGGTPRAKVPPARTNMPNIPGYNLPNIPLTPNQERPVPGTVTPPDLGTINPPQRRDIPSNVEPLHLNEVMGELYGAATNKVEPVPMQQYRPHMYTPYQVSFQDRLNQNQSSFNALQRTIGSTNPTALGALASQKYAADSGVKGEEFRTNQAISNDITNKNIALSNDAQLRNLGTADQQFVRQSTARSKTRELNQMIVNSLSSKYAQNQLENKKLAVYENLYDYRFMPKEQGGLDATYMGPDAVFSYGRTPAGQANNQNVRTVSRYDNQGNLKGYTQYDDKALKDAKDAMELEMQRRKLPLLTVPPLN